MLRVGPVYQRPDDPDWATPPRYGDPRFGRLARVAARGRRVAANKRARFWLVVLVFGLGMIVLAGVVAWRGGLF